MTAAQRVIGLIGGLSWESSAEYYRLINRAVQRRLGGTHSARCLMWSFDFCDVEAAQHAGHWDEATALMVDAAERLRRGGADFLVICSNTMHVMADAVERAAGLPLLHIADPTAERIRKAGFSRVGLLGTAFTMERDFYTGRLRQKYGLEVLVPEAEDRRIVHRIIYEELVRGRIEPASRAAYAGVMARLAARGAEAIILGCTEIMLLVRPEDSPLPLFDTTELHAEMAVEWALAARGQNAVSSVDLTVSLNSSGDSVGARYLLAGHIQGAPGVTMKACPVAEACPSRRLPSTSLPTS